MKSQLVFHSCECSCGCLEGRVGPMPLTFPRLRPKNCFRVIFVKAFPASCSCLLASNRSRFWSLLPSKLIVASPQQLYY